MIDVRPWLRPERIAVEKGDDARLVMLAEELISVVAADPDAPRSYEVAAACELAIAQYMALAGDWTTGDAVRAALKLDPMTRTSKHGQVAEARAIAKGAISRTVQDVVVRTRAIRNLATGTQAKRGTVLPLRKVAG